MTKKSDFKKIKTVVELENLCEEISDRKQKDLNYQLTQDDQKVINDIIEFYMDPKMLLE